MLSAVFADAQQYEMDRIVHLAALSQLEHVKYHQYRSSPRRFEQPIAVRARNVSPNIEAARVASNSLSQSERVMYHQYRKQPASLRMADAAKTSCVGQPSPLTSNRS